MKKNLTAKPTENNEDKALVLRLRRLVKVSEVAQELKCTERLVWYVLNDKRTDNLGIFALCAEKIRKQLEPVEAE